MLDIEAKVEGIEYKPYLCRNLREYDISELDAALERDSVFKLSITEDVFAVSKWVSPKRTRSYPYERVYDTLSFSGKRITIIPVVKDEGADGDRDFIQWDTICLMSLLNIYVIPAYYSSATRNTNYRNKITNQRFDEAYIRMCIQEIRSYQSDGLHWNLNQFGEIGRLMHTAYGHYEQISSDIGVSMHSRVGIEERIRIIDEGVESFRVSSRELASSARGRESGFTQASERLEGEKANITITNFYGGLYYFTVDEGRIKNDCVHLTEAKHSSRALLPSNSDIKDALLKFAVLTNLSNVTVDGIEYKPIIELKLTSDIGNRDDMLNSINSSSLMTESKENHFTIVIAGRDGRVLRI